MSFTPPPNYWLAGGGNFIDPGSAGVVRSVLYQLGIFFNFLRDRDECVGEEIEFAFAFGLGRLDHECAVNDEREADGIRMEAVIDEALGNVTGPNAFGGLAIVAENTFVHGRRFVGDFVMRFEQRSQIVGVEERVHGGLAETVGTVGHDIGKSADEDAEVAVEGFDAADGLGQIVIPAPEIAVAFETRAGKERRKFLDTSDRTGTGTAAAMRGGKCFMQVEVHDVDAEIARARDANESVHVGAVHIDEAAFVVHDAADFANVLFEDADGVGVGDHETSHIVGHGLVEGFEVDHAAFVRLDVFDRVADHHGGGGIGAVGRIGDEDFFAGIAAGLESGAHH